MVSDYTVPRSIFETHGFHTGGMEFEWIPNAESMTDDLASGGAVEIRRQI